MPGTVKLHRVLRAKPERVYRAFLDAAAMCKWLPPHGFTGTVHDIDARVGGTCRMSFTNFGTGSTHSFTIEYRELRPNEFLHYVDLGWQESLDQLKALVEPEIPDGA